MRTLLDNIYNYIIIIDKMGKIKFCNEKLLSKINYNEKELLNNNIYKLINLEKDEIYQVIDKLRIEDKLNIDININSKYEEIISMNCDILIDDFYNEENIFIMKKIYLLLGKI